ncbi:hypothetical protein [Nocardioides sp.]|uniref:hypothetical protein n=1 Tax=Nocardioides sp. TaxID=35761 RepID=UPI0039C90221
MHALLVDLERYPEWWPQVRAVAKLGEDDALVVAALRCPTRSTCCCTPSAATRPPRDVAHRRPRGRGPVASRAGRPVMAGNHERMMRGCPTGVHARLG